jgi:DNA-binding NtrC family response regulator
MATPEKTYRIALVDDEPQILAALRRELRAEPLEVVEFEDSTAALEAIPQGRFALILSDNLMPNLTGLELLTQIKSSCPDTRRVLLTGRTDLNHAVDAFNEGTIHCFLHKPWNKQQLIETVKKELTTYQSTVDSAASNAKLTEQNKVRTERLISTIKELKQTQTQLTLIEDSQHLDVLNVSNDVKGLSVLIVEEHDAVRDLLIRGLQGVGIAKVHGAANAPAALAHLAGAPKVDLILSEWGLPGTDGLELLKQIRAGTTPSAQALFLLMATHEQKLLIDHAQKSGINGYLVKPFHLRALLSQMETLRRQDSWTKLDDYMPLRGAAILVVNSHPAARDQIEGFLHQAGVPTVLRATFGGAALALIRQHLPDVVVYDVNVQEPAWNDLPKLLTKLSKPPAVLISGVLSGESMAKTVREAGVKHFLPGPFTLNDLARSLLNCWDPIGTKPVVQAGR